MTDYAALVVAAAHAAGPAPTSPSGEAGWLSRVQHLATELAFTTRQVEQAVQIIDASRPVAAFLERVEIEESSRRSLLTLQSDSGIAETIRTEQDTTLSGRAMIERARELEGRWVLVYRYNQPKSGGKFENVRMVARLLDLGEGTLANQVARQVLVGDAGGDEQRAAAPWKEAGLPLSSSIPVADFEPVRRTLRGEQL